ncbi:MAG: homoserine O-acetyltransferase [Pseudomonadales bacterium]|nr:homoserine O-acetyltransferase [Pseudomonadales bacterium]MBO6655687.1 homoserine O-acetyltransferase [Pseudomonadales bacterium]MBO6702118.1 homoserine O-acetyltransferase [Pseudomonadales bacterium]MBO7006866.1 homoserine O-acetyltransferase [Pseudomonadales bacterium]
MVEARKIHQIEGTFKMRNGHLEQPVVAYETWGELNFQRDNGILLFTGLSPSAHAASSEADPSTGWWEQMLGDSKPIDTTKYFVICVNSLGSCFGSTGPASVNPETREPYGLQFPVLTIEDIAHAGHEVVKSLGLTSLHAVVGASMGGMTSVAYSILYPDMAESLVSISGSPRATPFAISMRSLQREIIRSDPAWNHGNYDKDEEPVIGMRLARKLGMLTYRSAAELEKRFGRELIPDGRQTGEPFGIDFEVESYLEAHADKWIGTFDANCYLYLSRAMDLFDVADHGGSVEVGLSRIGARRALVIGAETDLLFPIEQQKQIADGLRDGQREVTFHALPSIQGHDAFLVDMDRFRPILCDFFNCSMNQPGKLRKVE